MSKTNRYRVLKSFSWEGETYGRGDHLAIEDSHSRIGVMCKQKFMVYDPPRPDQDPSPAPPVAVEEAVVEVEGARLVEREEPGEAQAPAVSVDFRPAVADA